MNPVRLNYSPAVAILLLSLFSQSGAQQPQQANRQGAASISGRLTLSGKPAVNAEVTITENNLSTKVTARGRYSTFDLLRSLHRRKNPPMLLATSSL